MSWIRGGYRFWLVPVVFLLLPSLLAHAQSPDRYKTWLEEDVRWIITPEERTAFLRLSDGLQREQFIIAFWERRNPTPGSPDNPFKMEHYRRIAYANQHFAFTDKDQKVEPGWKTDRGRLYIVYGPPDSIDSHPSGKYQLASGVRTSTDPYEVWSYKSIEGIGRNVSVRFVDACRCGDYRQDGGIEENQPPAPSEK